MRAGRLDRRISLQRATITQDSTGDEVLTWGTLTTVWAEAKPMRGAESFTAQQFIGKTPVTFRIRWSDATKAITVEDRIIFDERTFNILDVREIGRREGLEVDAYARSEDAVAV